MILKKFDDLEVKTYPAGAAKNVKGRVALGKADGAGNFCMRVIEVGVDGQTPFHAHDYEHEVYILQGSGQVLRDGEWLDFGPSDVCFIPANEEHQFRNSGREALRFICVIPAGPPEL